MDDVEDNSELRRGIPVAHHVYGVPQTINTANYVYFLAVQELTGLARHCAAKRADKGKGKGKEKAVEEVDLVAVVNGQCCILVCILVRAAHRAQSGMSMGS